jgi:hypothetical protein
MSLEMLSQRVVLVVIMDVYAPGVAAENTRRGVLLCRSLILGFRVGWTCGKAGRMVLGMIEESII